MRTERIRVADGIELAADRWDPAEPGLATGGPGAMRSAERPPRTAYRSTPAPFLLVHGLASNARLWDGVATALAAAGHQVVTVDLRGHGRSSKPDSGYDVATVAADLAALIERMRLDRPIVAGQSWGGNVTIELAVRHPEAVRAIALVDGGWIELQVPFPDWEACRLALAPPHLVGRPFAEVDGWIRKAHPDWPESGIRGSLANFEVRPDGTIAPWLTYERHLVVLRGLWEHHPSAIYESVTVPALLTPADDGRADASDKRRAVDAAAAAIPMARVRWFESDHDIHAQHPAELADVLHELTTDGFAP